MTYEEIFDAISKKIGIPLDTDEKITDYNCSFSRASMFYCLCVSNGVEISSPEELENLETRLSENYKRVEKDLFELPHWGAEALNNISEDAYCRTFDEDIIREAVYRGFYPMSVQIDVLKILSIRYHNRKCLVTPESFRCPRNIKKLIEKKFGQYTLTFNRAFSECVNAIKITYLETWLCPELVDVFEKIHNNPDERVSVDSVEIWHDGKLVAGEIGFITGNAYASLTGFHFENDIGNVQLAILGKFLFENGFAYWDLGMSIPYKYRFGAFDTGKKEQQEYWETLEKTRKEFPADEEIKLSEFLNYDYSSKPETIDPNIIIPFSEPNGRYAFMGKQICEVTDSIPLQYLYSAYMQGAFPWFCEAKYDPVMWYSTDPRFVLMPDEFHCPKSLERLLKKTPYTYTMDKCFRRVMKECAAMKREGQDGTWIGRRMISAYTKFHKAGYAHSFEVWDKGKLVGGFYGVLIGSVFCGESMFTIESDSAKSAFSIFMRAFKECGGVIVDCQSYTDNLARFGAKNISRDAFLRIEKDALYTPLKKDLKEVFLKMSPLRST